MYWNGSDRDQSNPGVDTSILTPSGNSDCCDQMLNQVRDSRETKGDMATAQNISHANMEQSFFESNVRKYAYRNVSIV